MSDKAQPPILARLAEVERENAMEAARIAVVSRFVRVNPAADAVADARP